MREEMKNKRNYGIDLLRSFSMCMVITLHFLGHGGYYKMLTMEQTMELHG